VRIWEGGRLGMQSFSGVQFSCGAPLPGCLLCPVLRRHSGRQFADSGMPTHPRHLPGRHRQPRAALPHACGDRYLGRGFYAIKSKLPYRWGDPAQHEGADHWVSFLGYQIRHDGRIRVRGSSLRKQIETQHQASLEILAAAFGIAPPDFPRLEMQKRLYKCAPFCYDAKLKLDSTLPYTGYLP